MLSYAELQSIYRKEKEAPNLQEIPKDFYVQVRKLMGKVEEERHKRGVMKLLRSIYLRRQQKILLHVLRTLEEADPPENITPEEGEIYECVREILQKKYKTLLNELKKSEAEAIKEKKLVQELKKEGRKVKKVRVLKPIPAFVGVDMKEYGPFAVDDEVELPQANVEILVEKKVVEEI